MHTHRRRIVAAQKERPMRLRQTQTYERDDATVSKVLHCPDVTLSHDSEDQIPLLIAEPGVEIALEFVSAETFLRFQHRVATLQWAEGTDRPVPTLRIPIDIWERVVKAIHTGARLPQLVEGAWLGFDLGPFAYGCQQLLGELARPGAEGRTP
jgi:hypothetical protein